MKDDRKFYSPNLLHPSPHPPTSLYKKLSYTPIHLVNQVAQINQEGRALTMTIHSAGHMLWFYPGAHLLNRRAFSRP